MFHVHSSCMSNMETKAISKKVSVVNTVEPESKESNVNDFLN